VLDIVIEAENRSESISGRRISELTNISRESARLILREDLCLYPYHPISQQALSEDDPQLRMEFAQTFYAMWIQENDIIDRIIYSDESMFHLSGNVNRHNCVYWSREELGTLGRMPLGRMDTWSKGPLGRKDLT
jgi:hypothetical protein